MRILRWTSKNTRKFRIQNEGRRLKIGVTPIDQKMGKSRLKQFSHVQSRAINASVWKSELIQVEGTEIGRRPKIKLVVIKTCQLRR